MKLIKLTLENFAGIRSFELEAGGKSLAIYGDNGTGKTTLADAQAWLLFGRDSVLTPSFDPKPRDEQGREIHGLTTSVRGVYEISGALVTLEKARAEDWKKKRGSKEAVLTGHSVTYYIDGVPKKEREYLDFLGSIADPQTLMVLSLPRYFSEVLDHRSRRAMLMSLTGELEDQEVIDSDAELRPLEAAMLKPGSTDQRYTPEEFLKIAKGALSQCNAELKILPERIDEASRALSDCADPQELRARITALEQKLEEKRAEAANVSAAASRALAQARAELEELRAEHLRRNSKQAEELELQRRELTERRSALAEEIQEKRSELHGLRLRYRDMKELRESLLSKWQEVSGRIWSGDTVCPTCGQAIPEAQLEEDRERFNLNKSVLLDRLNKQGQEQCSASMLEELSGQIEELTTQISSMESKIQAMTDQLDDLSRKRRELPQFEDSDEYQEARARISELLTQTGPGPEDGTDSIRHELSAARQELAWCEGNERANARIAELEEQQARTAEAYIDAERNVALIELFIRTKAQLLTQAINSRFSAVSFRLFKVQLNGGIQDDCETMCRTTAGQIPYSSANNAARINAGLDIISTFARDKGLSLPVFVDNAESITRLEADGLQIIRLIVSENDKKLRTEEE